MMTAPPAPNVDLPALRRAAQESRRRRDWPDLLERATVLRDAMPNEAVGHALTVLALRGMRRHQEMREWLDEALQRFPGDASLLQLDTPKQDSRAEPVVGDEGLRPAIGEAERKLDWNEVARLCDQLILSAPDDPAGYYVGARAARTLKRIGRAEEISRLGIERFADEPAMLRERAIILTRRKRLEEAADCYLRLRSLLPKEASGYRQGAAVLAFAARYDDAELVLRQALVLWPSDLALLVQSADLAWRRQDIALACERWNKVRAIAPRNRLLLNFEGKLALVEQLNTVDADTAVTPVPVLESADADGEQNDGGWNDADAAVVLKQFEGLGGNCEFGLLQRKVGLEPLGLLRFAPHRRRIPDRYAVQCARRGRQRCSYDGLS